MLYQAQRSRLPVPEGWAHYYLARVAYQWNDLDLAATHFGELVDKRYVVHAHAARNGMIGLVQVYGVSRPARRSLADLADAQPVRPGFDRT